MIMYMKLSLFEYYNCKNAESGMAFDWSNFPLKNDSCNLESIWLYYNLLLSCQPQKGIKRNFKKKTIYI